ncbi:phosphonate ABC transporter, permease protein PhnE [Roseibium polysiphoniae]|uniref:Phosphonate ABC transporter, permease protein PhnE n=1 Tax=Roseibium polysiphoniae TaxID=2571221 RepID=A0A944CGE4_9HYPH|nr:phosphonate ABC transporter, permease protein PhnE [Roseibium polysiphoniae]MBS8262574.1 phosphonate ABC transporter, permease protein PhnE [Roseibium polysiphoniae]
MVETSQTRSERRSIPTRLERQNPLTFVAYVALLAFVLWSFQGAGWSFSALVSGGPSMVDFLSRAWPPTTERLPQLSTALLETFQMALAGTVIGVILSVPLAMMATRGLTRPTVLGRVLGASARLLIAFFRTVPDLVWALVFVISVGLGPFAGTLAIAVDTIGFCGRFFAESMEDVEKGPGEALTAAGASRLDTIFCAVIPAAMPSFITTSLFALEKATRSSVVLGLVGAGGIGIELKVAMDFFDYQLAMTIILMIFALVLVVERLGSIARRNILEGNSQ